MGLWDQVRREVQRVMQQGQGDTATAPKPRGRFFTPEDRRGPMPETLVTVDEIDAATGNRPVGEPDRKGGGSEGGTESDIGFSRVCIWTLTGGDELLLNVGVARDADGLALRNSREDWHDEETPIAGLGDKAWSDVTDDPQGRKQLTVSAWQGMYSVSLVHSSVAQRTDLAPLQELMRKVLSRLP